MRKKCKTPLCNNQVASKGKNKFRARCETCWKKQKNKKTKECRELGCKEIPEKYKHYCVLHKQEKEDFERKRERERYEENKRLGKLIPKHSHYIPKWLEEIKDDPCWVCGWDISKCDRHRITPGKEGGKYEKDNTVIICPNCHRIAHKNPELFKELIRDNPKFS